MTERMENPIHAEKMRGKTQVFFPQIRSLQLVSKGVKVTNQYASA